MDMKKVIGLMILAFIALVSTGDSYAAGNNSLTFSETYSEKLVCYKSYGYCDVAGSGKFTVSSKILLTGIDINQFNSDTPIAISIEGFSFNATLGEAVGGYNPKKKNVRFVVVESDMDGVNRQYLTVTLSWSKTSMTVKVTCTTAPWYIEYPIIAGYYIGESSGGISEPLAAEIDIDDLYLGFDLTANGSVKTKTTDKKDLGEYDTSSISVKASGIGTVLE
jgi:hypothetical protein